MAAKFDRESGKLFVFATLPLLLIMHRLTDGFDGMDFGDRVIEAGEYGLSIPLMLWDLFGYLFGGAK